MEESILNFAIHIPAAVDPLAPAWKAWRIMKSNDISVLPVISERQVVGLITHQDILRFANQNGGQSMPVREVMQPDPLIVNAHDLVRDVIHKMINLKKEYAVIVDDFGKFHGVYNWTDAMQLALNHG